VGATVWIAQNSGNRARPSGSGSGKAKQSKARHDRRLRGTSGRLSSGRDIELVQATGKHVKIFVNGQCYLARQALRDVEARLDGSHFVSVHRSIIIDVEHVELHPLFHGDYEIGLKPGARVTLSRRFRNRILPFLVGPWPT